MSQEQKNKRLKKILNDNGRDNPNVIISRDGSRTAIKTPTAGKKTHQVKRKRVETSRTPSRTPSTCNKSCKSAERIYLGSKRYLVNVALVYCHDMLDVVSCGRVLFNAEVSPVDVYIAGIL
ncbi:hypothetical protein MAR_006536, partial [Mya arenaria]